MNENVFLGLYIASSSASDLGIVPAEGVTSWQAWQSATQEIFLQGVDANFEPVGSVFEVTYEDFLANFTQLHTSADAIGGVLGSNFESLPLSASDPNLLEHWLESVNIRKKNPPNPADLVVTNDPSDVYHLGGAEAVAENARQGNTSKAGFSSGKGNVQSPQKQEGLNISSNCEFLPADEEQSCILEEILRSEFAMLIDQWRVNAEPATAKSLHDLIVVQGHFSKQQKLMFSEFGLALRKNGLHALALQSHLRARELDSSDSRVLFNIARSQSELGQILEAQESLVLALALDPNFTAAQNFLDFLKGMSE